MTKDLIFKKKYVYYTIKKYKMGNRKIFVQIASYRDPELLPTIRDCINKAKHPEMLTFGICWQRDETESMGEFADDSRFTILDYPWNESKGLCWARSEIQKLWKDEEYTMQLDSHHRFLQDWDEELITMMKQTGSEKPIITSYAGMYRPSTNELINVDPYKMVASNFTPGGTILFFPTSIPNWETLEKPIPARFVSGHFFFTIGKHCEEYKYDPNLYFAGDEISLSIRSYTLGYDLFHPHKTVVWHEYTREGRTKHWTDFNQENKNNGIVEKPWWEMDNESKRRLRHMLQEEDNNIDFEQWGDAGMDDVSWGYMFEVPLNKYIEYLKTENYYTGGELKKGIKTEMEHKDTIKKIKTGDYTIKESAELIAKDHLDENDKYYTHLLEMEKQFSEGGLTDKKEDFNVPTTESLIELVSKEREKYIKNLRKQGFKVVVGRNDGYYWNLESEKDGVSELAKNPSKRKVLEIIKNNPNVTKIGFQGTLLVADKVGEELEIVDDFAVILWEKDSMFFKEGLNFEFVYDNGKYINVIVNKNDTETYKDRKDDGNYVYFKSIDKKYNTISERRSKIEFLKEEFDNGEAFIVDKMENGGKVESINSKKGNIKLSLDEYMYSDDTDVELVPVSELVKFREFDRKKNPKYNKENSIDNINHLKFMFQN